MIYRQQTWDGGDKSRLEAVVDEVMALRDEVIEANATIVRYRDALERIASASPAELNSTRRIAQEALRDA
jgi:hypothetical protein